MNKDVVIETDRLILRQWTLNDMVEGLNNINVTKSDSLYLLNINLSVSK